MEHNGSVGRALGKGSKGFQFESHAVSTAIVSGLMMFERTRRSYANIADQYTVKTVLVATSIKKAICIKQACIQFPQRQIHCQVIV